MNRPRHTSRRQNPEGALVKGAQISRNIKKKKVLQYVVYFTDPWNKVYYYIFLFQFTSRLEPARNYDMDYTWPNHLDNDPSISFEKLIKSKSNFVSCMFTPSLTSCSLMCSLSVFRFDSHKSVQCCWFNPRIWVQSCRFDSQSKHLMLSV